MGSHHLPRRPLPSSKARSSRRSRACCASFQRGGIFRLKGFAPPMNQAWFVRCRASHASAEGLRRPTRTTISPAR
jgi:hypothetical protein